MPNEKLLEKEANLISFVANSTIRSAFALGSSTLALSMSTSALGSSTRALSMSTSALYAAAVACSDDLRETDADLVSMDEYKPMTTPWAKIATAFRGLAPPDSFWYYD